MSPAPRVGIVLACYRGAAHLAAQLDSLAAQDLPPVRIVAGDDGSPDATRQILEEFARAHPSLGLELHDGPRRGEAAAHFLTLLARVPEDIDLLALCDQDDIWFPGKLLRAARALAGLAGGGPALYCGRTLEWWAESGQRRLSRGGPARPGFRHALVQNIAGGNTMVLNRAGLDLVRTAAARTGQVVVHDWWIYQLVTGAGGQVVFDDAPQMLYRQHAGNLIGANTGPRAKLRRLGMLVSGRFRDWNDINIAALRAVDDVLTPENRALLDSFARGRRAGLAGRLAMLRCTGLHRNGLAGEASLWLAAVLGRL